MRFKYTHTPRLSVGLGADEQRSESYSLYGEQVAQSVTTPNAKNGGRVDGSAGKQDAVARRMW